jgi:hypothetical protein
VIDTLFACTEQTLSELAVNPKWMGSADGALGFSLVLRTWTQDLQCRIHLHAAMGASPVCDFGAAAKLISLSICELSTGKPGYWHIVMFYRRRKTNSSQLLRSRFHFL